MSTQQYAFGMIGLGTMGRNLLLNMGDHGFAGAGFDKDPAKGELLEQEDKNGNLKGFSDINAFVASLSTPRSIMMLVPAGKIVDDVIAELTPLLEKGDIIIDGGNSHFTDTNRRVEELEQQGFHFFGMGVSGGAAGARRGPSIMPGGDKQAYAVMQPILEAIAARAEDGQPCVTYIGPGAAGHFVKMVHNGIEYGVMQLLAEAYGIMKNGLAMNNDEIGEVFAQWNQGRLKSFLVDITADIFTYKAPGTDHLLIDDIKDEARSKGTGKWTSQIAFDLQAPITVIDASVSMRDLSKYKALRVKAAEQYGDAVPMQGTKEDLLKALEEAFFFAVIISYAQGLHMLSKASEEYKYDLKLAEISKIWRAGCIIRSQFLNDIYNAYTTDANLEHLLLDGGVKYQVVAALPGIRKIVATAAASGIAAPCLFASLSYFDAFRTGRLPSNLTQAQRDYFGSHTYELIGKEGVFHTEWQGE